MLPDKDPLPTIFQLLIKQQRVSEQTNRLIESMVGDVSKAREQSERLAILINRVENLERGQVDFERRRTECMASVVEQFRDLDGKREQNKDKISQVEQSLLQQIATLKAEMQKDLKRSDEELRERVDQTVDPVEKLIGEMREKIAFSAGKYGGLVALIISLVAMLLQYVLTHPIPSPKP